MDTTLRSVRLGVERVAAGYSPPRHRHLEAYVTVVLSGAFEQVGYAGRLRAEPGAILLQPTLDAHGDQMLSAGLELLRIPWRRTLGLGGLYDHPADEIVRAAQRDLPAAVDLLSALFERAAPRPPRVAGWEDDLALRLRSPTPLSIGDFAEEVGLSRETVWRGFRRTYGVAPSTYRTELRAREAWAAVTGGDDRLCDVAAQFGFADQPHMTRAIRALTGLAPAQWRRRELARPPQP